MRQPFTLLLASAAGDLGTPPRRRRANGTDFRRQYFSRPVRRPVRLQDGAPEAPALARPRVLLGFSFFDAPLLEASEPLPGVRAVLPRWQLSRQGRWSYCPTDFPSRDLQQFAETAKGEAAVPEPWTACQRYFRPSIVDNGSVHFIAQNQGVRAVEVGCEGVQKTCRTHRTGGVVRRIENDHLDLRRAGFQ